MQLNFFLTMAISALVPLIVGFVWYNPKFFGNAWMRAGKFDEARLKESFNMPLVFGLTIFLGFLISFVLAGLVIHQMGFWAMTQNFMEDPSTKQATNDFVMQTLQKYGGEFRSFKHGALHGTIAGIGLALPIIGVNAMFERHSFKYVMINAGFWILCMMLMGGIICQFADLNSIG